MAHGLSVQVLVTVTCMQSLVISLFHKRDLLKSDEANLCNATLALNDVRQASMRFDEFLNDVHSLANCCDPNLSCTSAPSEKFRTTVWEQCTSRP